MASYSDKLKDPRWQKKRLEVLQRDNWTCTKCGDTKNTLHVHHEQYFGEPWDIKNHLLKTLCVVCHEKSHLKEEKKVVNIKAMKSIFKHAFLSELLSIRNFSDYNENPKGLPGHIKNMWDRRQYMLSLSETEFQDKWGRDNKIKTTRSAYCIESHDRINNECFDWNLILIDDREPGFISNLGMSKIDIKNKDYNADPEF